VIAGVDYVAQNGRPGDVANMSLGGGVSTALDTAVVNAAAGGVRFALAAGNETDNANNHSPARANGPNVFTISAFQNGDRWASFSNYGNPPVDFAEPGVAIKSTWLSGGYNTISGTSMATPHFAGLLLLGGIRSGGTVTGDPDGQPDTIAIK
jgi:subtilisin family serine protease